MSVLLTIRVGKEDKKRFYELFYKAKSRNLTLTQKEMFSKMLDLYEEYLRKSEGEIW